MEKILRNVVFTVGSEEYCWDDVLLAGMYWGDWPTLESEVREGAACVRHAENGGASISGDEVDAAAKAFRYDRNLITAREMQNWLNWRGLTAQMWMGHVRRSVLRRKSSAELPAIISQNPLEDDEVQELLAVDGFCSGHFDRWATKLAGRASAAHHVAARQRATDESVPTADDSAVALLEPELALGRIPGLKADRITATVERLAGLERAFRRFRMETLTPRAIRERIGAHHLEWIRVVCRSLAFPEAHTAREAALCLREDGAAFAEVAASARAKIHDSSFYLDEVDGSVLDRFVAAREGEFLGPIGVDGQHVLFEIVRKVMPTENEEGVRRRAERDILNTAVNREITDRVKWCQLV
ncbi:MAG: hypothetical protein ABR543_10195 [Gemmatimonadaceae bacterium]